MGLFDIVTNPIRGFFDKRKIEKNSCQTQYPILMVHGIAYRDDMPMRSWGQIPDYLRAGGAIVELADTQAWASYTVNAVTIKNKIHGILNTTGAKKVNILAHSKGGIDCRYAISNYNLGDQVASLTTISTPHRGTYVADLVTQLLPHNTNILYRAIDCIGKLIGDKQPETNQAIKELTRSAMKEFNQKHKNSEKVYYQSSGAIMLNPTDDLIFSITKEIIEKSDGKNDGMIAEESLKWGNYLGTVKSCIHDKGISHGQITGSFGSIIAGKNIAMQYVSWVSDLKNKGF